MEKEGKHEKVKKSFWKDWKNIVIIILAFLVVCCFIAYSDSDAYKHYEETTELNNQINSLKAEIEKLNNQKNELNTRINETSNQVTD